MNLRQDEKGTTLVEVIAAVTLLAVALLPILGGITEANNAMIQAGKKTQALYLAQKELEITKAEIRADARQNSGRINIPPENTAEKAVFIPLPEPNRGYAKKIVMKQLHNRTYNLVQLEVTVKWGELANQKISLVTQVTGDQI